MRSDLFKLESVGGEELWSPYVFPERGEYADIITITNQSCATSRSGQLWNSVVVVEDTGSRLLRVEEPQDPLLSLLSNWLADDSGYDQRIWPELKKSIESNRLSTRRRFRE